MQLAQTEQTRRVEQNTASAEYFDFVQSKFERQADSGFTVSRNELNQRLFGYQTASVEWALRKGKAAIFAGTGLGKTAMQIEWANQVRQHTGNPVLIAAPLCVAKQTVTEAQQFGIDVEYAREPQSTKPPITITNYEMIERFDLTQYSALVLDESSILKSVAGKFKTRIIESAKVVPYRLSCTATPSPNDFMEIGNQAEFLNVMTATEMLAMFFVHDGGDTSKWRLKGHARDGFWRWMASWCLLFRSPSDIGFDDAAHQLPPLHYHEHVIETQSDDALFPMEAQTLAEQRAAQKQTLADRCKLLAEIVNATDEPFLVWCNRNDESALLTQLIPDAQEVTGSHSIDDKECMIDDFTTGMERVLVTKPSICGFGMNWQHCRNMGFVGLNHSFEQFYQAVRRCWRFGQTQPVNVHIVSADIEGAIVSNIKRKEQQFEQMQNEMVVHMENEMKNNLTSSTKETIEYSEDSFSSEKFTVYRGDAVLTAEQKIEPASVGYTIFSPPFASLYTYSNSVFDMGNVRNYEQFQNQFDYLAKRIYEITIDGRLCSFHCMNLPTTKQNHGYIGIHDFRGDLIRMFESHGWIYHSEVCIWKDPVIAMQRTKALGLLHKQIKKDSAMSRQGIPDYVVTMRKPEKNPEPITNTNETFPVQLWQKYASPIWMDINPSDTLQYRSARENEDEKHICPLQLEVISRCVKLWSNEGDLVYSPFAGIGSEGYIALKMGRRFVGSELKESYYRQAVANLQIAERESEQESLLSIVNEN